MISLNNDFTKLILGFEFHTFMIIVTNRCNLDCKYCYFKKSSGDQVLSPEEVLNKIKDFKSVVFTGGEPLLNYNWIKEFLTLKMEKNITFDEVILFTNGTLLNDEIVQFLKEHNVVVNVSLDGPGFVHDFYRVFPDGSSSFDLVMRGIELLKKYKVRFYTTSVLSHFSYNKINRIINFSSSLGFKQMGFSMFTHPFNYTLKPLSIDEIKVANDQLLEYQKRFFNEKLDLFVNPFSFVPLPIFIKDYYILNNKFVVRPCFSGLENFTLNVDGKVFPCQEAINHPNLKFFNLSEIDSFSDIKDLILKKYYYFISKLSFDKLSFDNIILGLECPIRSFYPTKFYINKYSVLRDLIKRETPKIMKELFNNLGIVEYYFSRLLNRNVKVVPEKLRLNNKYYNILLIE